MSRDYADFLTAKVSLGGQTGPDVDQADVHSMLHDWQAEGVVWAVRTGRAGLFWDCGLGKTFAQLEWARLSGDRTLILAPLSVARQTVRESAKLDMDVRYVRDGTDAAGPGHSWFVEWMIGVQVGQLAGAGSCRRPASRSRTHPGPRRLHRRAGAAPMPERGGMTRPLPSFGVGPFSYLSMRFTGGVEMTARSIFAGRWSISVGPEDGLSEGLMDGARVRWLKGSFPQVMLVLSPEEAPDA